MCMVVGPIDRWTEVRVACVVDEVAYGLAGGIGVLLSGVLLE